MVRLLLVLVPVVVVITIYAVVDCAMLDNRRVRGLPKPIWLVVILILPIIGLLLWFLIGRGSAELARTVAPDDDPAFLGGLGGAGNPAPRDPDQDDRIRDLEAQLAALDDTPIVRPHDADEETDADRPGPATGAADGEEGRPASSRGDAAGPDRSDADRPRGDRRDDPDGDAGTGAGRHPSDPTNKDA